MAKFILAATVYILTLLVLVDLFPNHHPHIFENYVSSDHLLHELAPDQVEFNQSLPEIQTLKILDPTFPP
jgi:hypothetical protein